jgi:DNA-binding SARP family transcriptional activator/DNA-binding beta-propeller fold protein YncE
VRGERAIPLGSPKQRALLAILLLHANQPIPRDRLIEELWGDDAPATANAALNGYLSKLRRTLGHGVLATERAGYVLRVPRGQLDALRFESLLAGGRRLLRGGDAAQAADTLGEALALWRGPALADCAYERFAQQEIARLDELRLAALEERIEADLALGRHGELAGELEALVFAHPLRERFRAQLMLALYRSGRQAEALMVYRDARRALVDELGIEPGRSLRELEQAILRHDPSLELARPASVDSMPPATHRRSFRPALVVLAVAAAAIAAAVSLIVIRGDPTAPPVIAKLVGNSIAVVDAAATAPVREIRVGGRPAAVAVGEDAVWVANGDDRTLLRLDPDSGKVVRTIGLGVPPSSVAVGAGAVWVASDLAAAVVRVDPTFDDPVATIEIRLPKGAVGPYDVTVGGSAVWVAHGGGVTRIDPATNTVVARVGFGRWPLEWRPPIAFGDGALWVALGNRISGIDPRTNSMARQVEVTGVGRGPSSLALVVGGGAAWVTNAGTRTLWKIDLRIGRLTAVIELGRVPAGLSVGGGNVWAFATDGTVLRIDAEANTVADTAPLGVYPALSPHRSIAFGNGAVWLATVAP